MNTPMLDLKPVLVEGETVLGEYGATVYRVRGRWSSAGSNVRLWLTNQRLILKAGLGPQRTLPLYAITNLREQKILWYTMVRIEFDNGHLEWLTVQDQAQFLDALRTAQANAPKVPDTASYGSVSPVATGMLAVFGIVSVFIIAVFICMLLSVCLVVAVLTWAGPAH